MAKLEGDIYRMKGLKAIFRNSGRFDVISNNNKIGELIVRETPYGGHLVFRPAKSWKQIRGWDYAPETLKKIAKLMGFIEKED